MRDEAASRRHGEWKEFFVNDSAAGEDRTQPDNVEPMLIEQRDWASAEGRREALDYLYAFMQRRATGITSYYFQKKTGKRLGAYRIRFLALTSTILAAIGLVVVATIDNEAIASWLRPLAFSFTVEHPESLIGRAPARRVPPTPPTPSA